MRAAYFSARWLISSFATLRVQSRTRRGRCSAPPATRISPASRQTKPRRSGAWVMRCGTPSSGSTAPSRNGTGAGSRSRWATIQSSSRSTKARPAFSETRGGRLRTMPRFGSMRRRRRAERAERLISRRWVRPATRRCGRGPPTRRGAGISVNVGVRPINTVIFHIPGAAHGDARRMHRFGIARNERMPPEQGFALIDPAIGAAARHPAKVRDNVRRQRDAIGHKARAFLIAGALACAEIEQPAGDIGIGKLKRVFIFQLEKAAFAAAVAERLPLFARHIVKRDSFPDWFLIHLISGLFRLRGASPILSRFR